MSRGEFQISEPALAVLSTCTVAGQSVVITAGQLDRKLYLEVHDVLVAIGGKWSRKTQAHVFEEPPKEIAEMLEGCIQTGIAVPLRPGDFFVTPDDLARTMVRSLEIEPEMKVLEPSAGDGNIVAAIISVQPQAAVVAVEKDAKLVRKLHERFPPGAMNVAIIETDFLTRFCVGLFDRVVMNPPFSFLADIDHVSRAYDLLNQGGRLISVMSAGVTFRMEKKAQDFRKLIESRGSLTKLPIGSFKSSNTMVNTILVELRK